MNSVTRMPSSGAGRSAKPKPKPMRDAGSVMVAPLQRHERRRLSGRHLLANPSLDVAPQTSERAGAIFGGATAPGDAGHAAHAARLPLKAVSRAVPGDQITHGTHISQFWL